MGVDCAGILVVGLLEEELLQKFGITWDTEDEKVLGAYEKYEEDEYEWIEKNLGEDFNLVKCYDSSDEIVIGIEVAYSGSYSLRAFTYVEFQEEIEKAVALFREVVGEPKIFIMSELST